MSDFNSYGYNPYQYNNFKQYAFVNGIEGAKAYQMPPNQTMLLMDSDNPIAFMKTSDSVGKATLRYFKLMEINEAEVLKMSQPKPAPEYVLKSDFDNLSQKLDSILESLKPKEDVNNG